MSNKNLRLVLMLAFSCS